MVNNGMGLDDRVASREDEAGKKEMMQTTEVKADGMANDVLHPGDQVKITWDRYWKFNTSTRRMPKTEYEGATGTVLTTTKCFAWVQLKKNNKVVKKKKHNLALVPN